MLKILCFSRTKIFSPVLLCLILFANTSLFAQLNAINLKQYTESDGLPGAEVHAILSDKFGYIWIGTINGLARYDGYEFKRFFNNPNDSTSIKGLNVWSMFEDSKGQIWVESAPSFLNVYNPANKSFRHYDFANLIAHPANVELGISSIAEDSKGRIYLGVGTNYNETISDGLLYIDEKSNSVKKFITEDKNPIQNVYDIIKDKQGNIWFLSFSGLFKIDINRQLHSIHVFDADLKKNNQFFSDFKFDKENHLWALTYQSSLYDLNLQDSSFKVYPPNKLLTGDYSYKIAFDKNENIWLGTSKGLMRFDKEKKVFETFQNTTKDEIEKVRTIDLVFDSFGSLWIGTAANGLLKYEERSMFKSYNSNTKDKDSSAITPGWVTSIVESHDKKIWIPTSGSHGTAGLNVLDPKTGELRSIPYHTFLPGCYMISALTEINPGEWMLSTNLGIYKYFAKTKKIIKIVLNGVADSTTINHFYTDSKGNEWLCTLTGLFKKNKGSETFSRYDLSAIPSANASSNEITRAFESKKHGLWLITNNGLFLYDYVTDKISRHGYDKNAGDVFITQDINSFYESPDGIAWVGTWQGGLSEYNVESKKIKTFTREDGLPSMSIQSIIADEQNNTLWLSTFDGLSRLDLKTKQFNNFSIIDGIQGQLFADGSYLKTSDGSFVFGGSNGITIFDPDAMNKNSTPPKVFLTDLKLFNRSIVPGEKSILKDPIYDTKEIELSHDQNNISIDFIALHYTNPAKNKYAYKLDNYDNDWREVGNQHTAFYPTLSPGKYIFHVKAANNNGVWNEEGATLTIIIDPPWWKTIWAYIFYGVLLIVFAVVSNRYLRQRLVQKERSRNQARELAQAKEIEKAYNELKTTQAQLIQAEKMASLGELTAGIAHEIQNPLNFVNNFSEVNTELIDELEQEADKGNISEVKSIAKDIKENEQKISHHGKRADAIVKGMLQHSRSSIGEKEPADINALADEYLRLSYHGLRAKDKSFNAMMKTDFDQSIGKINIIPQDIGRVLLNLYNNAFYAVSEKAKLSANSYQPTAKVSTRKLNDKIEIRVEDNGNGIPKKILDKIFQPFFTTKPTGQGTGLGLSLSYDIIKAHSGEIKVETKEGEGSEFIIQLPTL